MVLGQPVVEGRWEEEGLGLVVVAEALVRPRRCSPSEPGPARSPPRRACRRPDHLPWANLANPKENREYPHRREGQSALWRHWGVLTHAPRRWRPSSPTTSLVSAHSDSSSPGPRGWTATAKAWPTSGSVSKRSRCTSTATLPWSRPAITPVAAIKASLCPKRYEPRLSASDRKLCSCRLHMSFIAGTQGSPPMPGPTDSAESSAATNVDWKGR